MNLCQTMMEPPRPRGQAARGARVDGFRPAAAAQLLGRLPRRPLHRGDAALHVRRPRRGEAPPRRTGTPTERLPVVARSDAGAVGGAARRGVSGPPPHLLQGQGCGVRRGVLGKGPRMHVCVLEPPVRAELPVPFWAEWRGVCCCSMPRAGREKGGGTHERVRRLGHIRWPHHERNVPGRRGRGVGRGAHTSQAGGALARIRARFRRLPWLVGGWVGVGAGWG